MRSSRLLLLLVLSTPMALMAEDTAVVTATSGTYSVLTPTASQASEISASTVAGVQGNAPQGSSTANTASNTILASADHSNSYAQLELESQRHAAQLQQENQRLQVQLQESKTSTLLPGVTEQQSWFVIGSAAALLGVVIGALLRGNRKPRREWLN